MPCVTSGAGSDRAVLIRLADAMAFGAAAGHRSRTFQFHERVSRPLASAGVELLGKGDLLGGQAAFAIDGGPRRSGVAAAHELLINRLVARAAIGRCDRLADDEAVVVGLLLSCRGLMTVEASHIFGSV